MEDIYLTEVLYNFQITLKSLANSSKWEAICPQLNISASGNTCIEARENLVKLIEFNKFKLCE